MRDVSKTNELIAEAREQAAYLRGVSRDGSMPYSGELLKSLADALVSVRAERDTALAAIERVAVEIEAVAGGITSSSEAAGYRNGLRRAAQVVRAALDGAPEPEWEVQYGRRNRETGALHWLTGDPRDDWWHENQDQYEHVKRYTSPPLPVDGENE